MNIDQLRQISGTRMKSRRVQLSGSASGRAHGEVRQIELDAREQRLFRSLDLNNEQRIPRSALQDVLLEIGFHADDVRLVESMSALYGTPDRATNASPQVADPTISNAEFCAAIRRNILLIERALQGDLIIPDFADFSTEISRIYDETKPNRGGRAADYIPQLDLDEPELDQFGVAVCTVDGQRYAIGDSKPFFSVQSTCKPINYCLALEEHGEELVHQFVGHEPSGASFNELALDKSNRPHNPLINAGAIMTAALIKLNERRDRAARGRLSERDARGWAGTRFEYVMNRWEALCGGRPPRASLSTYLSERQTADRNFALGYYMRENNSFPEGTNLEDVLEFYFQCCSIELNTEMMSLVAGAMANGGVCPVTGERVFKSETIRRCLALMSSCGMYDYSGEFAFTIGIPAKSSVSGALLIVIPNVMGICTWSPRLDEQGNSVRGIEFCRRLVNTFNFHNYDSLTGMSGKIDPRVSRVARRAQQVSRLVWAASKGDLHAIQSQCSDGADLGCSDYDGRTPLHLAAVEGQASVVQFLIERHRQDAGSLDLNPRDRWGGTPLDDAYCNGHGIVIKLLEDAGAVRGPGAQASPTSGTNPFPTDSETSANNEMIWAASTGDLSLIRRLVARGVLLGTGDYDRRTPLHLAAAEGHMELVQYFVDHRVDLNPIDRWGNSPLDEAIRHEQSGVVELLLGEGATNGDSATGSQSEGFLDAG